MSNNLSRRQITGLTGGFVFANIITSLIANGRAQAQAGNLDNLFVSGSVGIGTTSPSRKLDVRGTEIHSGGSGGGFSFGNRETAGFVETPNAGQRWVWYALGGTARLWSGGDKVTVNTSGVISATLFLTSSSREVKENIAELSSREAIETLEDLHPVKFSYKADSEKNLHNGFIAEDVPNTVATFDRKAVSSMDIVAVLTKVVKEQQNTIAILVEKVKMLEDRST
ncbi:MAG TPA: tail fiber domain-containing protein [Nostoc sp.]|uniref:tail fiber domain-containing protein n=1 Tax=Nostoc sp. TaxID=1180 RepID=UPI002D401D7B|nr:tail fiber domain-containing protein [Nostoc sp.]HYX13391.1 tail fiber domain-containing protein [Nostoc sp.]